MKKFILMFLVVAIFAVFAGCNADSKEASSETSVETTEATEATSKDTNKQVTLSFSYWVPDVPEFFAKYEEETGVKVEYEMLSSDQYVNILNTRLNSGEGPDIFAPRFMDIYEQLIADDAIVDLSDYEFLSNYSDEAVRQITANDGKIYGIPESALKICMFYNKDLFEQHNVKVPTNYDEYLDACETFKQNGVVPQIQGMKDLWQCKYVGTDPVYTMCGIDASWADRLAVGDASFSEGHVLEAYQRSADFIEKGYLYDGAVGLTFIQAWEIFCNGEAAMMSGGTWYSSQAFPQAEPNFEIGTTAIPLNMSDEEPYVILSATSGLLVVNKNNENAEEAIKFLEWWSQPENLELYSTLACVMSPGKDIPATFSEESYIYDDLNQFREVQFKKEPSALSADYGKVMQNLVMGTMTPEEMTVYLQEKLDAILSE